MSRLCDESPTSALDPGVSRTISSSRPCLHNACHCPGQDQRSTVAQQFEETQELCAALDEAESDALEAQLCALTDRQQQLQLLRDEQSDHVRELRTM